MKADLNKLKPAKIKSLRMKYNLSYDDFAKVIGCAKKTLIWYEFGKSIPLDNYMILLKMLDRYPISIFYLIEANREQFRDSQLRRIYRKIEPYVGSKDEVSNIY